MKIVVDNQVAKLLDSQALFEGEIEFRWPSLLEYLGVGSLFLSFPDHTQECISLLSSHENVEAIFDNLFAVILNQINALPEIQPTALLQSMQERPHHALKAFENALTDKPKDIMHDLILYLGWDRMCVQMARLFDYQSTDSKYLKGIATLRECLIESFQHISQQGRTRPSLYRMLEAFLFYEMREENLERLTEAEWSVFSQSFQVLKAQDELADFFYIDDPVLPQTRYATFDSPDQVNARLAFAQTMLTRLGWNATICYNILYL